MPVRCASRSSSERRKAGPPERPSTHGAARARRRARPSSRWPSPASAPAASRPRWAAAAGACSGIQGRVTPSNAGAASEAAATCHAVAGRLQDDRPAAVEDPRQLGGQQLHRRALGGPGQRLEQLQLAVGVQRPGERPQRLDRRRPGTACAAVIRLSGSRSRGSSTTTSSTATPCRALQDVEGHDVDAGVAEGGGDRAQDAGPVGHDQAQEIGHGSSGVVLEVRADLRRSRWVQLLTDPVPMPGAPRNAAPRRVARSRAPAENARRRAPPKWSPAPA